MKKPDNWKLLADLNISPKTVQFLNSQGIDCRRVDKTVGPDKEIAQLAEREGRVILTFDKDFGEIYYFHKERSFTVIVLAIANQTSDSAIRVLERFFQEVSFESVQNKLIILSEERYRIVG